MYVGSSCVEYVHPYNLAIRFFIWFVEREKNGRNKNTLLLSGGMNCASFVKLYFSLVQGQWEGRLWVWFSEC